MSERRKDDAPFSAGTGAQPQADGDPRKSGKDSALDDAGARAREAAASPKPGRRSAAAARPTSPPVPDGKR